MLIGGYDWNAYTTQALAQAQATEPLTWWQQSRQHRRQAHSIAGGTADI